MENKAKLYSEIARYEIININNGEKYNYLANNDIIIDENGELKFLVVDDTNSRGYFNFFSNNNFLEIPWECVSKIGTRTIIVDVDELQIKKSYK